MNVQNKVLKIQMLRFAITGTLSTLIMFLIYISLNKIINYQLSYLFAYCISVLALYFMNMKYVFKKKLSLKSFLEFPLIYLFQYLAGAALLGFMVHLGFSITFAPLVIVVLLLPLTFLLNRLILY